MSTNPVHASNSDSIRSMFSSISGRYDLANTVLSLGTHHGWRKAVVRLSGVSRGMKVLDCASGTGDLAFEFERTVGGPADGGEVIATDFCEPMLEQGIVKGRARGSAVRFQVADVMNLPFESDRFDAASISFGIRNVADPVKGLSEMGRCVRPGGIVMVLEFGQSRMPVWGRFFDFYSKNVLPTLGGIVTGKPDAYKYLQRSSAHFPCRDNFLAMARKTGLFDEMSYTSLMGGIAYAYRLRRKGAAQ